MSGLLPDGCETVNDALAWGAEYAFEISDCLAYSIETKWLHRYKAGGKRWDRKQSYREVAQSLIAHLRRREFNAGWSKGNDSGYAAAADGWRRIDD